jgi:putative nucleotidyltransferase with HDIG domain
MATPSQSAGAIRVSELLAALSRAVDLTAGYTTGHAVRSCLIAMRIADRLDLPPAGRSALFYALLLKDTGCSATSPAISELFEGTDEMAVKRALSPANARPLSRQLGFIVQTGAGRGLRGRIRHLNRVARHVSRTTDEVFGTRCERGAEIARLLTLPEATAATIASMPEHWDGSGRPRGLKGEEIPLGARIAGIAQTFDAVLAIDGLDAAYAVIRRKRASMFDPSLVAVLEDLRHDTAFWRELQDGSLAPQLAAVEPADRILVADDALLDRVAQAFAQVVDAKSPYTADHSERVATVAVSIATELGLSPPAIADLRRAALLHDIGKLGVPNSILDKPGRLTAQEWDVVRRHPEWTHQVLDRVAELRGIAEVAAAHHERLDGSGYHRGLGADELSLPARILAVADVYDALTADRAYRAAMPAEQALGILRGDAGTKLDADAVDALSAVAGSLAQLDVAA